MIDLRPSGSSIWTKCAANPAFSAHAPKQPDSDAAREGTCAAWVAESVLKEHDPAPDAFMLNGMAHENGWIVTPDMCHHVQGYVDLVRSRGGAVTAERFVRLNEYIAGTLDSSVDSTAINGTLTVDDLKYGHKIVEPYENTQVIIYAEAEARRLEALGVIIEYVKLGIYQPRVWHPEGPHRQWPLTRAQLAEWAAWVIQQGALCQAPQPVATPGDHCRYCDAAGVCAANSFTLSHSFDIVRDHRHRQLSAEELSIELDFLDRLDAVLKGRKTSLMAEGEARMRKGEFVRGWHLKPRKGNRQFKTDPVTVHMLTGVDPREISMVTPAELERRGANPDVVASITYQPDIPPQMARVSQAAIRKAFGA